MNGMNSNIKYPDFRDNLLDAIRRRAPGINATRKRAGKFELILERPAHFKNGVQ
jgi:hypothetical protein